jgi:uncharacterized protein (DUF488 family)
MKIFTLGYSGIKPAKLKEIVEALGAHIIDVRLVPQSRWHPEWNSKALASEFGNRYTWIPDFGNLNYKGGQVEINNFPSGVGYLRRAMRDGRSPLLLCCCKNVETCHRKVVAELIQGFFSRHQTLIEIQHISLDDNTRSMASGDSQISLF